jgi:hypothetical protein
MGFKGKEAGDSTGFKKVLYTGVTNFKILTVCPTASEINAVFNIETAKDKDYKSKTKINEKDTNQIRLDFLINSNPKKEEGKENIITTCSIYLANGFKLSQTGKYKCVNAFGQFAWLTKEDIKAKTSPYAWFHTMAMRRAYEGEEQLTKLIKSHCNVPSLKGDFSNIAEADAAFDEDAIKRMLSGNMVDLKEAIDSVDNKVAFMLGVRTTDEGKQYQTVLPTEFGRQWMSEYPTIVKELGSIKERGAMSSIDFGPMDLALRPFTLEASSDADVKKEEEDDSWE